MTNDHDGRVRPGGQILEYGSWVIDGFCVANDHDGAVGREAVNHQGSRLGSEAADGVYFDCVWFNSVARQTLGIVLKTCVSRNRDLR